MNWVNFFNGNSNLDNWMLRILKQTLCTEMKKQIIRFKGVEIKSKIKRKREKKRKRERERDFGLLAHVCYLDCPYSEVIWFIKTVILFSKIIHVLSIFTREHMLICAFACLKTMKNTQSKIIKNYLFHHIRLTKKNKEKSLLFSDWEWLPNASWDPNTSCSFGILLFLIVFLTESYMSLSCKRWKALTGPAQE